MPANNVQRRIILLVYPGFELLDLSGPVSVFGNTNDRIAQPHYDIHVVSAEGGLVRSDSGVEVASQPIQGMRVTKRDTVLVTGANREFLPAAMEHPQHQGLMRSAAKHAERWGSVCSGTFVLAATGLLDHRPATSHWAACQILEEMFPNIQLNADALYVRDDRLWTSAGVTTGIDMSLAMVREDLGNKVMGDVARGLVVYTHRPGNQSQFSGLLQTQLNQGREFNELLSWLDSQLHASIRVEDMAARAGLSERSFHRKFTAAVGVTPAKYLEVQRLERAKQLLEGGRAIKAVAGDVGFRSEAAFRKAFQTRYGLTPSMHKTMHAAS
jgi:transcriptional regulator GlxA family with amidase domain